MREVTFTEFISLLLVRLYELEKKHGAQTYLNLKAVAQELNIQYDAKWIFDAGKVLESRNLTQNIYSIGGNVACKLTGEGRLFVEERSTKKNEIISDYYSDTNSFMISGNNNQVSINHGTVSVTQTINISEGREELIKAMQEIRNILDQDESISAERRKDLNADIDTIEIQLKKEEPNKNVIAALLEPMSKIASIAGAVGTFIELLN